MVKVKNIRDSYKLYAVETEEPVTVKLYINIVLGFIKFIMKKIFDGYSVNLSEGDTLGSIHIQGKKHKPHINEATGEIRGLEISWSKTKDVWLVEANKLGLTLKEYTTITPKEQRPTPVYCFNEHSNGIGFSFKWVRKEVRLRNIRYYYISLSRTNKRTLMTLAKAGKEYMVVNKKPFDKSKIA